MGVRGVSKNDVNYRGPVTVTVNVNVNETLSVIQSGVNTFHLRTFHRTA
jgi:hypothetical protein